MTRPLTTLGFGLLCLVSAILARAEPELRRDIIIGVPRARIAITGGRRSGARDAGTAAGYRGIHPPADRPPGQIAPEFRHDCATLSSSMPRGLAASRRARPRDPVPDRTTTMVPPDSARLSGETVASRLRLRRQRDGLSRDGPSREPALPPDGRRPRGHCQEPAPVAVLRAPSGAGPFGRRRLHTWDDVMGRAK